jgi:dihydroflavonol-4-reductase
LPSPRPSEREEDECENAPVPVLVTGATGFLGRHLVTLLRENGERVRALVRSSAADAFLGRMAVDVCRGDLFDDEAVRLAARGCDRIFHLAGLVAHEHKDVPRLIQANVEGVRRLLDAAEGGARIVHTSSVAAVGPIADPGRPADEHHVFAPEVESFPYAATKRAGEQLALERAARGMDVVVANPGFLLGPGDVHRVSTWMVQRYLDGILRFHSTGGLSFVDARDVAQGLVALADRGRSGERYILTSSEGNLRWPSFFRRLGEVTGVRRTMVRLPRPVMMLAASLVPWPVKPGEARAATNWWFYTAAKAEAELGFVTRSFDETLEATATQYRRTARSSAPAG